MLLIGTLREGFGPQVGSDLGRAMEAERTIIQAQDGRIHQEESHSLRPGEKLPHLSLRNGPGQSSSCCEHGVGKQHPFYLAVCVLPLGHPGGGVLMTNQRAALLVPF